MAKRITMAKVGAPHGIRGWVRLHSFTDPVTAIRGYRDFYCGPEGNRRVRVHQYSRSGRHLIAALADCEGREQAAEWTGTELLVDAAELPAIEADEYYWHELTGMQVRNRQGAVLGQVCSLMDTGAQDVLVVRQQNKEHLIPWVREAFDIAVDRKKRQIVLDWEMQS